MGVKKIILWGYYHKKDTEFHISGGCKYKVTTLAKTLSIWENTGQEYVANAIKNRITPILDNYLDQSLMTYPQYLKLKYLLGYFGGKITEEELEDQYPNALNVFYDQFEEEYGITLHNWRYDNLLNNYLEKLSEQVDQYEKTINRIDIKNGLTTKVLEIVKRITDRFYDAVKHQKWDNLPPCPELEYCQDHIDPNCGVYFYGSQYLSPEDPRILL